MEAPRFSIVVPTRNRFETLLYCLQTCLEQDFGNYEIIVSDNSDEEESKETRKVVNAFNSERIKYFKTDSVLSMTDNYEFALSKVKGEYVIYIGDDDGLIINSLEYVNKLIKEFDAKIIKGPVVVYYWKSSLNCTNSLYLPYPTPLIQIDNRSVLKKVASFQLGYFNLPMIYYSFIAKEVIDQVISRQGSFFGNAASPDMYSGMAIAYFTSNYVLTDIPFAISGVSGKSNGSAEIKSLDNKTSREHYEQLGLHQMYKTYEVPQLSNYNLQLLTLLELKKFKKNFKLSDEEFNISTKKVITKFLSKNSVLNKKESLSSAECFREYEIYKEDVRDVENEFLGKELFFPFMEDADIQIAKHMFVNPDYFHIDNVFDAAVAVKNIFTGYENVKPVPIKIVPEVKENSVDKNVPFIKKYYKRMKRAGKILLRGYE